MFSKSSSSLSILLAIIAFFMLALSSSVSALPVPHNGIAAAPGTLLGRTYSRKPAFEGVMISRSPSPAPDALGEGVMISRSPSPAPDALGEDEELELLSRSERFQLRNQLNRRNVARHASTANTLARRIPEPKANTIQLVAKRGL